MPETTIATEDAEPEEDETEGGESEEIVFKPRVVAPAEGVPIFYTNIAQVIVSPWDFTYRFALVDEAAGKTIARLQLAVIHSPPQAKAFLNLLQRQLESYEKRFGTIPDIGEVVLKGRAD